MSTPRHGHLRIVRQSGAEVECLCDCGRFITVARVSLERGHRKTCGECGERGRHRRTSTPLAARIHIRRPARVPDAAIRILAAVAYEHGTTVAELTGPAAEGRKHPARTAAMARCYLETRMSLASVGVLFSRRCHTTVRSAVEMQKGST